MRVPPRQHLTKNHQYLYKFVPEWSDETVVYYGFLNQPIDTPLAYPNSCGAYIKDDETLHLFKTCFYHLGNFVNYDVKQEYVFGRDDEYAYRGYFDVICEQDKYDIIRQRLKTTNSKHTGTTLSYPNSITGTKKVLESTTESIETIHQQKTEIAQSEMNFITTSFTSSDTNENFTENNILHESSASSARPSKTTTTDNNDHNHSQWKSIKEKRLKPLKKLSIAKYKSEVLHQLVKCSQGHFVKNFLSCLPDSFCDIQKHVKLCLTSFVHMGNTFELELVTNASRTLTENAVLRTTREYSHVLILEQQKSSEGENQQKPSDSINGFWQNQNAVDVPMFHCRGTVDTHVHYTQVCYIYLDDILG